MAKNGSNQAKRERKKKKNQGKQEHSWRLSGPSPSSLLREGERQNKRHKKRMSQRSINARAARSKASSVAMRQGGPQPKSPSAVGRAGGPAERAALVWPGQEGRGAEACPTKGKRLPLRIRSENTHSVSRDELAKDD